MANEKLTSLAKRLRPFIAGQVNAMAANSAFMTEGPDIDIIGQTIGRGGDTILLFDSGGNPVAEYAATSAGLVAALAAATSGDVVQLPAGTIVLSGGGITVPSGITLCGLTRLASILQGAVTNNGTLYELSITGNVINTGRVENVYISISSGNGITSTDGDIYYCDIFMTGGSGWGIYATGSDDSVIAFTTIKNQGGVGTINTNGIYINYSDIVVFNCRVSSGNIGAQIENAALVSNCRFESFGSYALYHTTGVCDVENSSIYSISAADVVTTTTGLTLTNVSFDDSTGTFTYGRSDRGAYSVEDYHAADIETPALTRHLPLPGAAGGIARSNGTNWARVELDDYLSVRNIATITTGTTTLNTTYDIVICNAAGGNITVNLPAAASNTGRVYTIKRIDSSANTVTVDGNASETIDDQTTVMLDQYTSIQIACDGSEWWIL